MVKNVLVTGGFGLLGKPLVKYLSKKNFKIFVLDKSKNKKRNKLISKNIASFVYGNFQNKILLKKIIKNKKIKIIFHTGAITQVLEGLKDPYATYMNNIMGTVNLLNCIIDVNSVNSVVIVTTDKVYKIQKKTRIFKESDALGGFDPYSSSKVGAEIVTESYIKSFFEKNNIKKNISSARSGNVIGGGDYSKNRLMPDIVKAINKKNKIVLRNPNHVRPWQHVMEPLIGYLTLAKKQFNKNIQTKNKSWNFGPKKENFKRVIDVIKMIQSYKKIRYKIGNKSKQKETKVLRLNSSKANKILKWSSLMNLNKSIKKTLEWNELAKKGIPKKKICENQFLMYIKNQ